MDAQNTNTIFWKEKSLQNMTETEWESLCCRCGICCLNRIHDRNKGKVQFSRIACKHLDPRSCSCTVYHNRFEIAHDCNRITPYKLKELSWLPRTCGYRTIFEGRNFEWWHPLVSGVSETVHQAGVSIRNADIISEQDIIAGDLLKSIFIKPF